MAEHHITVVIPPSTAGSVQTNQGNSQSTRDVAPHQQQHQPQQHHARLQQASQQHAQKQPHITQQQLQQYWLQAQGVQQSMDDLASYAYHVASSSAKSALSLHQATWQHKQQLEAIVKQQSARLQQQAAELEVLRSLSTQQTTQLQQQGQPQQSAQQGAGLISSQDSRLQRQVEWQRQEVAVWYTKCRNEKQGRQVAESALQDTLVIVEQLEQECAGISSMLQDVITVDAATAAAEAEAASKKRWRPTLGLQTTRLGLAVQIGIAVVVAGCAAVASAYIALSIRGC